MSTEIVKRESSIGECFDLSDRLAGGKLLPAELRDRPADILLTLLHGRELGLEPGTAIRAIHIIEGKPSLSADLMVALVLRSGLAVKFTCTESTDQSVTYTTTRHGDAPQSCTWTMADAKRAGLAGKGNWTKYPRQMLGARARAELARRVYPDVLSGCYTPEELGSNAIDAEWTEPPARAPDISPAAEVEPVDIVEDAREIIAAAATTDELQALAPRLGQLQGQARDDARELYGARMAELRKGAA